MFNSKFHKWHVCYMSLLLQTCVESIYYDLISSLLFPCLEVTGLNGRIILKSSCSYVAFTCIAYLWHITLVPIYAPYNMIYRTKIWQRMNLSFFVQTLLFARFLMHCISFFAEPQSVNSTAAFPKNRHRRFFVFFRKLRKQFPSVCSVQNLISEILQSDLRQHTSR